jgi:hypothetical protein
VSRSNQGQFGPIVADALTALGIHGDSEIQIWFLEDLAVSIVGAGLGLADSVGMGRSTRRV